MEIEELNKTKTPKKKELGKFIRNTRIENPFDFTDYAELQKEINEINLGLIFDLAEENNILHNQVPVITLIKDMEKLKKVFLRVCILL